MEELTGLDARFLYSETPTAHMHTMKVVLVDVSGRREVLTPELLATVLAERLDRMPGFRRRAVPVPHLLSHPVWVEEPFDPTDHIAWRKVDSPGDRPSLANLVADIAAVPLRRDRPLWELTVVEGLADGRLAFVVKLHHALADGVAAAAMLENVFQGDDALVVAQPPRPEAVPEPQHLSRNAAAQPGTQDRPAPRPRGAQRLGPAECPPRRARPNRADTGTVLGAAVTPQRVPLGPTDLCRDRCVDG